MASAVLTKRKLLLAAACMLLLWLPLAIYGAITGLTGVSPTPTNGSNTSFDYFVVNFTFINTTDAGTCLLEHYNTTMANYTMNLSANATGGYCWFNATNQADGNWNFSVYLNETSGTAAMNGTWFVTVDTTKPLMTLYSPANTSYASTAITLNFSHAELHTDLCWFNRNGTNTTLPSCSNYSFTAATGPSTLVLYINDTAGNLNQTNVTFTVDTTFPEGVVPTVPTGVNGTSIAANYALMNFTFIEANPGACLLSLNNGTAANQTMSLSSNATGGYCFFNATGQPDGRWNYSVYVNDSAGNINSSGLYFITVDANAPSVTIYLPQNTTYNSTTVNISYNSSDTISLNVTWLEYNGTNTTLSGNATFTALGNASSNVIVWANDSVGNVGYARTFFSTDTQAPTVSLSTPGAGTDTSNSTLNFSFIATDNLNTLLQCNLTINGTIVNSTAVARNGTTTSFYHTISNLSQALQQWNVTCRDNASVTTASACTFTYDATYPTYTIYSPQNTTYSTGTNLQLNFTSSDTNLNATYYSIDNLTNYTLSGNVTFNASEGFHNVSFHVNDSAGNLNSTIVHFTVDLTTPVITALSPSSGTTWSSSSTVEFTYNVSDVTVQNCTLVIDPANDENSTSVTPNATQSFSSTLTNRLYTWYIRCYDKAGRTNVTSTRTLTVSYTSSSSQQSAGSGQSSGSGSNQTQETKASQSWDTIATSTPAEMNIDKASIPVTNIKIEASESMPSVSLEVEALTAKPSDVAAPSGEIYKYLKLEAPNLNETRAKTITINFKVEKSWADANNIDEQTVALMRYSGGAWKAMPTSYKGSTLTHHLYNATTPGFSYFAIGGSKRAPVCAAGQKRCVNATFLETCSAAGTSWGATECKYGCDNATSSCYVALSGSCAAGERKCQGDYLWRCGSSNATAGNASNATTWELEIRCKNGCIANACAVSPQDMVFYGVIVAVMAACAAVVVILLWHEKIHHVGKIGSPARSPMKTGSLSLSSPILLHKLGKMESDRQNQEKNPAKTGKEAKASSLSALKGRIEDEAAVAAKEETPAEKAEEARLRKEKAAREAKLKAEEAKAEAKAAKTAPKVVAKEKHNPFVMPVPPEELHIQKPRGVWLRGRLRKWK